MKEIYPGYFPLSEEKKSHFWADAAVVFDANIILNLYRYSKSTRDDYIGVMRDLAERIWVPNQVAFEYLSNRISVILEQEANHVDFLSRLNSTIDMLNQPRAHPFIDDALQLKIEAVFKELNDHLNDGKAAVRAMIKHDDILNSVSSMFAGRIGESISDADLLKLFEEGGRRFLEKIPPGFKDVSKADKSETMANKRRIFGDLIIWKEIIQYAKAQNVDIIFVTDDEKEDWWHVERGQKIGPRPELVNEFYKESKKGVMILNSYTFLEMAKSNVVNTVKDSSVSEVKDAYKQNEIIREGFSNKEYIKIYDESGFDVEEVIDREADSARDKERLKKDFLNRLIIKLHGIKSEIQNIDLEIMEMKNSKDINFLYKKILLDKGRKNLVKRRVDIEEAIKIFGEHYN